MRNLGIGRFIAKDGAIDEDQVSPLQGAILRMNEGFEIGDLQHLPPEIVPPVLIEFIQFISGIMTDMMPSLSQIFAGEAPYSGLSGRAVASLQFANFSQLSDNIKEMNEFRLRRDADQDRSAAAVRTTTAATAFVEGRSRYAGSVPGRGTTYRFPVEYAGLDGVAEYASG